MVFKEAHRFFADTVWLESLENLPWYKRILYRPGRVIYVIGETLWDARISEQSGALTYVTFLSIIPLLAVLFSLAKAFGFQQDLIPLVHKSLQVIDEKILNQIISYIDKTPVAALGGLGLLFLLWTILRTLLYLEHALNKIWGVAQSRPIYRALAYYLSVVVVVPLLMVASTTLMTAFHSGVNSWFGWVMTVPGADRVVGVVEWLLPFLFTWIAFAVVYSFMVNTHVRFKVSLVGGLFAGILWQILQWLYIKTQVGLSRNIIYGTFAFLPVFLVYINSSWFIILLGSKVAFAVQNDRAIRRDRIAKKAGVQYRTAAGMLVLQELGRAFQAGEPMKRPGEMAQLLDIPDSLVVDTYQRLERAGILLRLDDPGNGDLRTYAPSRALDKIALKDAVQALESDEAPLPLPPRLAENPLQDVLERAELAKSTALESLSLEDVVTRDEASDPEEA